MHLIESIVSIIFSIIFFIGFAWLHFLPLMMSIKSAKYLKNKEDKLTDAIWFLMIFSLSPALIFIYLVYEGLTCGGGGCFSGLLFVFFSLPPTVVLLIINQLYRNYILGDERKLPKS